MKKAIILTLTIGVAIVTQAASFKWSASAGTAYEGYSVYVAKGNSYATLAALQGDLLGSSGNSGTLAKASASARNATASGTIDGLAAKASASDANIDYNFYFVFVKDNNYWVSAQQTASIGTELDAAPTVSLSQSAGTTLLGGAATGSFGAVPEPTSGLLLLLGIAGLALKRKRA